MNYIKEMFLVFLEQMESHDEYKEHYKKLREQANKGLLDTQLEKVTPHNDLADLFEEFHEIHLVNESLNVNDSVSIECKVRVVSVPLQHVRTFTITREFDKHYPEPEVPYLFIGHTFEHTSSEGKYKYKVTEVISCRYVKDIKF